MNLEQLREMWRIVKMVFFISYSDARARYKRSIIGPFWITLGTAVGTVGLGFIWGALLGQRLEVIIPQLSYGIVLWQFISSCISEAPLAYQQLGGVIKNQRHPLYIYPLLVVSRNIINLFHNSMVVLFVAIYYQTMEVSAIPQVFFGLIILIVFIFWLVSLISLLGTRYRDVAPIISTFMPILVFFTPVLYRPDQLGHLSYLMWFNPLSYVITLVRDPLIGESVSPNVYFSAGTILFVVGFFSSLMMKKYHHRVALWV